VTPVQQAILEHVEAAGPQTALQIATATGLGAVAVSEVRAAADLLVRDGLLLVVPKVLPPAWDITALGGHVAELGRQVRDGGPTGGA
jgi:hypothetical protein